VSFFSLSSARENLQTVLTIHGHNNEQKFLIKVGKLLYAIAALIVVGAVLYFILVRSQKSPRPVETAVEAKAPAPTVSDYKKEVQSLIDQYRSDIASKEMSKGCRELSLCVIGKVEDVARKPNQKDVKQYGQSMKIRLEAFRASYRGEPSYEYNCSVSNGVDTSNALVDIILQHLQKRIANA
jgi:hypothetical protein